MGNEIHLLVIFRDSFTLIILAFCSVLSFTFMIERWLYFRKAEVTSDEVLRHVHKLLEDGKADQAQAYAQKNPAAVSQLVHYGLQHASRPRRDLEELLASKRLEERMKAERN